MSGDHEREHVDQSLAAKTTDFDDEASLGRWMKPCGKGKDSLGDQADFKTATFEKLVFILRRADRRNGLGLQNGASFHGDAPPWGRPVTITGHH